MKDKKIEQDFNREYRVMQQVGNTAIALLRAFEGNNGFMREFQKQYLETEKKPNIPKYWRLFYSEDEINNAIENNTPLKAELSKKVIEFQELLIKNELPETCFVHDIKQTNIYKQFKKVQSIFDRFKKMRNYEPTQNGLIRNAEETGKAILIEVEAISYKPIQNQLVDTIIKDEENINIYLLKVRANITNTNVGNFNQQNFTDDYNNAKTYLNNYLLSHVENGNNNEAVPTQETEKIIPAPEEIPLKSFKEIFERPELIDECINLLKKTDPPCLSDDNKFIGGNKGIIIVWFNALIQKGMFKKGLIFNDNKKALILSYNFEGFSVCKSIFGKDNKRATDSYKKHFEAEISTIKANQNRV